MNRQPTVYPDEEQLLSAWFNQLKSRFIDAAPAQSEPVGVVIAGPPGSGKSVLAESIRRQLRDVITIDSGEFLLLHPAYSVFLEEGDEQLLAELQEAAADVAAELLPLAVQLNAHVMIECCFEDVEAADNLFGYLSDEGYRVIVVVPADGMGRAKTEYESRASEVLVSSLERGIADACIDELSLVCHDGRVLLATEDTTDLLPGSIRQLLAAATAEPILDRFNPGLAQQGHRSERTMRNEEDERVGNLLQPAASLDVRSAESELIETRRAWQRVLRRLGEAERDGDL